MYKLDDIQIFVTTHNRAEFLKDAIISLLHQTAGVPNITVLDNESTDNTESVVKEFQENNVKYIRTNGFLGNYKKAKELASKKYIMLFHDDDLLHPKYLEFALSVLNTQENISLITTRYKTFSRISDFQFSDNLNSHYYLFEKECDFASFMYYKEEIAYASAIYRTSDFLKNDLEYEKFSKFNDWPFLVKIAGKGNSVLFCDSGLFYARIHCGQDTNTFENTPSFEQIINWDKFFYQKLNAENIFSARHYLFMNRYKYFLLGKYLKFLPEKAKSKISQKEFLKMAEDSGLKPGNLKLFYCLLEYPKIKKYFVEKYINKYKKYSV